MKYYKIVIDKEIKGVVNSFNFFIENNKKLISSTDSLGQFVEYEGKLYRDYWMPPIPNNKRFFFNATINEISREEYFAYLKAKQENENIIIEDNEDDELEPEQPIPSEEEIEEPDAMTEYIRESKLNEMSRTCRQTIEAGFDIILSDNESHHFSLDTQDQLNLITLSALAETQDQIPYHADNEICKFYSAAEIKQIVAAATQFKMYHTTYYNALKGYINSLETIADIAAIQYGVELPEEFQSDVLKAIS